MPNNVFHFQQFSIYQDLCGMKVSTDACVFGAWLASLDFIKNIHSVLDIGTGTGLLSLMLAQASSALSITGVEIDENAFEQSKSNFGNSIFSTQLTCYNLDILKLENEKKI